MTFPLSLEVLFGKPVLYLFLGVIGFLFGYVLEISGFGDSRKLAGQFYFRELTVLKVMFTAIVVAMVLIFVFVGLGILDFNQVWVNPTYLWPGIVGGLIMGVGFIIGGFCPGTSLVSAVTGRIDGIFFALGTLTGIFLFGETVPWFETWWNSSYYGRLTLMDVFHLSNGVVVLLVVLMALFMFWGGEQLEHIFGKRDLKKEPRLRVAGALALALVALAVVFIGAPSTDQKWAKIELSKEALLTERQVQISPGELLASIADDKLKVVMLDVRPEGQYNLFHLRGAQNLPLARLDAAAPGLLLQAAVNTVFVVMSNDETLATQAWKTLVAQSVPNVYILEGGLNNWLRIFAQEDPQITPTPTPPGDDQPAYVFSAALGSRYSAASPNPLEWKLEYTPKIKLQIKRDKSGGGCG